LRSSDYLPHIYVSKDGKMIFNSNVPHLIKHVMPKAYETRYHNLTPFKSLHQAVAHAWVFNPCPDRFFVVDHINGNTHDNRAVNLRFLNQLLNMTNRKYGTGISYIKRHKKWLARVTTGGAVFKKGEFFKKAEAEFMAALWRDEKFHQIYKQNVVKQTEAAPDYSRPPGLFYWRDTIGGSTNRTPSYLS